MLPLEIGGDGLLTLLLLIFLAIFIVSLLVSFLAVFIYAKIQGKIYTRKDYLMRTGVITAILLVVSGVVCGL